MGKGSHCSKKLLYIYYLYYFQSLNLRGPLWGSKGKHYYSHLMMRKSETQRSHRVFPMSHSMRRRRNRDSGFYLQPTALRTPTHGVGNRRREEMNHRNQLSEALVNRQDIAHLASFGRMALQWRGSLRSLKQTHFGSLPVPSPSCLALISTAFNGRPCRALHYSEQLFWKAIWQ